MPKQNDLTFPRGGKKSVRLRSFVVMVFGEIPEEADPEICMAMVQQGVSVSVSVDPMRKGVIIAQVGASSEQMHRELTEVMERHKIPNLAT